MSAKAGALHTASFTYDPFGRRIGKTLAGTTTRTLYDAKNPVQETQGTSTANLLTGLSPDSILARTTSSATQSYLTDALGSTIALASSTASIETSYTYDPFGATTQEGTASTNPFQYTSRENDGNGLYYNRARYYSPAGSRFTSQDPTGIAGSGPNLYLYTGDSPTNATDPMGTNLQPPGPSLEGGNPGGIPGGNGASGGNGSTPGGPGATPGGGLGPSPTPGCTPGPAAKGPGLTEGNGLFQAVRCRNYERVWQAEEENHREEEAESDQAALHKLVGLSLGCSLGGASTYMVTRAAAGGPGAVGLATTFCAGYAAGELIIRPVLHELVPTLIPG